MFLYRTGIMRAFNQFGHWDSGAGTLAGSGGRVCSHLGTTKEVSTTVAVMLISSMVYNGAADQSGLITDWLFVHVDSGVYTG